MLTPVNLDNEMFVETDEIDNVFANGLLSATLRASGV
jgi:hypothetical protein